MGLRASAFDPIDQYFLAGCRSGGDEDRVVAADVADHFRPVAAIERQRDPLGGADRGLDNGEIRPGRQNLAQELHDALQFLGGGPTVSRELVALPRLDCPEFAQVAAHARLRGRETPLTQGVDKRLLRV